MTSSAPATTPSTERWGYRPHLDGLRAVAVYLVVLYHARIPAFEGGFVGVDLFFVLSGYLVTSVLVGELLERGTIDLSRFYARRVRRLLPAAAVLVVGVALAAVMVSSSLSRASMVDDARAASLWFANWHFVAELSEYFAVDGPESPFIHFWSLAIEEQYYLVFPLVVLVVWRIRPRLGPLVAVVAALAGASLTLQLVIARSDVNRAYLGTDTRVYQILVGSLLALVLMSERATDRRAALASSVVGAGLASLSLVGLVLIGSSAVDLTASWRGVAATAVSLMLLLALEVMTAGPIASLLAWRPLRWLGQISYGTYLWHWPVMLLASTVLDMSPIATAIVGGVVGTGLAALSAELIERPIRSGRRLDRRPRPVIAGGVTMAAAVGLVVAPAILDSDRRPVVQARSDAATVAGVASGPVPDLDWRAIETSNPDVPDCELPDASDCYIVRGGSETILLMGDSHARMLIPAMEQIAVTRGVSLALSFSPSCPWQLDLLAGEDGDRFTERCRRHQPRAHGELLEQLDPDWIVLAGFPRSTARGTGFTDRAEWQDLGVDQLVATATTETIERLARVAPLVVVEPVPILGSRQIDCLSAAPDIAACAFPPDPPGVEEAVERRLAADLAGVVTVDLDAASCPAVLVCEAIVNDVVVRRDAHHFTPEFARTIVPLLDAGLDAVDAELG